MTLSYHYFTLFRVDYLLTSSSRGSIVETVKPTAPGRGRQAGGESKMIVRCSYCDWVGEEPNSAAYDSLAEYEAAYAEFRASHDNPEFNTCPAEDP